MKWFETNGYIPSEEFQYYSKITTGSPIQVSHKTCTFSRLFVGAVGGSCIFTSDCHQVIQVDEDGKQVVFKDHWDENAFAKQLDDCYTTLENDKTAGEL